MPTGVPKLAASTRKRWLPHTGILPLNPSYAPGLPLLECMLNSHPRSMPAPSCLHAWLSPTIYACPFLPACMPGYKSACMHAYRHAHLSACLAINLLTKPRNSPAGHRPGPCGDRCIAHWSGPGGNSFRCSPAGCQPPHCRAD